MIDLRCFKDLAFSVCGHKEELAVRRKRYSCHRIAEVEMSQDNSLDHIDDQCKTININADQSTPIWRQNQPPNVTPILKWHCLRHIGRQIKYINLVPNSTEQELVHLISILRRSLLRKYQIASSVHHTAQVLKLF